MATPDVPGANPANGDQLSPGCWAEHQDGSLIRVDDLENGQVVYRMFDLSKDPVMVWEDRMSESDFKQRFSGSGSLGVHLTWHDKTAFPWERVMSSARGGARPAGAQTILSAAARIAERLNLGRQPTPFDADNNKHLADELRNAANDIIQRVQQAIDRLSR